MHSGWCTWLVSIYFDQFWSKCDDMIRLLRQELKAVFSWFLKYCVLSWQALKVISYKTDLVNPFLQKICRFHVQILLYSDVFPLWRIPWITKSWNFFWRNGFAKSDLYEMAFNVSLMNLRRWNLISKSFFVENILLMYIVYLAWKSITSPALCNEVIS